MPHRQLKKSLRLLMAMIITILLAGTVIFSLLEDWSLVDSFYFVAMTATTVGYGDFTPTHTLSKLMTVIYSLTIIPFILFAFSVLARYQVEKLYRKVTGVEKQQKQYENELENTLKKIRANNNLIKSQQEELEKHQNKIKHQQAEMREQEKKLEKKLKKQEKINDEQKEELEGHQREIKKAEKEIKEHDEELEVVEDIVEEGLIKKLK